MLFFNLYGIGRRLRHTSLLHAIGLSFYDQALEPVLSSSSLMPTSTTISPPVLPGNGPASRALVLADRALNVLLFLTLVAAVFGLRRVLKARSLSYLALDFQKRFEQTGDRSDLDQSIKHYREALKFWPETYPGRAASLSNLSIVLGERFKGSGERSDLDQSIKYGQESLDLRPERDKDRARSLTNLAIALGVRFDETGERHDLDQGIEYHREALNLRLEGRQSRAISLHNLSLRLWTRYEEIGDDVDLDQSIEYKQEMLALCPLYPERARALSGLALRLSTRFEKTGNTDDLDRSIECYHESLYFWPEEHPDRTLSLSNLAAGLMTRFDKSGDRSDLDEANEYQLEVLILRPEGHPDKAAALSNLSAGLQRRFGHTGDRSDLDQSIQFSQEALNLYSAVHPLRATILSNLAMGLLTRSKQTGDRSSLDQSIRYSQEALDLRPEGHSERRESLSNLAAGLWVRFEQIGDRSDLNHSIEYNEDAARLWPEEHPAKAKLLSNLAVGLRTRFEQSGDRNDLDQSLQYGQESLGLLFEGDADRVGPLSQLATGLGSRFEQTGVRDDLDQSIEYHREVLNLRPKGHLSRAASLSNLAVGLQKRFEHAQDINDLNQSIEYGQEALNLWPKEHPSRVLSLSNLAAAHSTRLKRTGDSSDRDRSIQYNDQALNLCPEGHPSRAVSLSKLADILGERFEQTKDRGDLDQSIRCHQEALKLWPGGHVSRVISVFNLAVVLLTRFENGGDRKDLDQSIEYHQNVLKLRVEGHPDRAQSLSNLTDSLSKRFELAGDGNDLILSLHSAQEGAIHESSPVAHRLKASLKWVAISRQIDDPSAMEAYSTSISLLDHYLTFARSIGARHFRLTDDFISRHTAHLASDAASYALERSLPETAIEFLERGRSINYSQLGNYRISLVDLEAADLELVNQFRVLSARLEGSVTAGEDQRITPATNEDVVARYQRTATEWAQLVERIRRLPGFSAFLKGKTFQELQLAAVYGPVTIINISEYRSDAIIVQYTGPPLVVPLPDAPQNKIRSLSEKFNNMAANPYDIPPDLADVLREIWRVIVGPVTMQLERNLGLVRGSRIYWIPTSRACSLPLHAAGLYVKGKKNMPERFISSYTSTLSMLLRSIDTRPTGPRVTAPHVLLVSQAIAEGEARLPGVLKEMGAIREMFPQAITLDGEACTRDAVLDGLKSAEWVHFSCHGNQDQAEPFKSHFSLYKKKDALTLLDIIKHGRPKAQLAVLSACHSARGDKRAPDEAVHMAAGMQFSGFKSVIGSMWASADEDGPIIAEVFYRHMLRNGVERVDIRDSAAALYEATKALRRRQVPLERWINFVHYGV